MIVNNLKSLRILRYRITADIIHRPDDIRGWTNNDIGAADRAPPVGWTGHSRYPPYRLPIADTVTYLQRLGSFIPPDRALRARGAYQGLIIPRLDRARGVDGGPAL